jgi:hypothetical protein
MEGAIDNVAVRQAVENFRLRGNNWTSDMSRMGGGLTSKCLIVLRQSLAKQP